MNLSPHFDLEEFDQDAPIPADCLPTLEFFCINILEPIRVWLGRPMEVTSGYRPPDVNAATHGSPTSDHMYTPERIAADFTFDTTFGKLVSLRATFDWIRTNPLIPWTQVILEHGAKGSIIHIGYNKNKISARSALEGATHNASPYQHWEAAAYQLPDETAQENA